MIGLDVDVLFGVMGDANLEYIARYIEAGGSYLSAAIEGGAVGMADGYARHAGRPGVVSVTHGPALTNAMTALVESVRARTALLLITGDTPSASPRHSQEFDIRGLARTAGAHYVRARSGSRIADELGSALDRCEVTRSPVVLDLCADVLDQDAAGQPVQPRPAGSCAPDEDALDRALGILASTRRPVVLGGRGARLAGAADAIATLAEHIGAPLATTLLAKDLFGGHAFDLGTFGTLSTEIASEVIARADCIVSFGASLNNHTTMDGSLLADKALIRCDIDAAATALHERADAVLVGDATLTAGTLYARLRDAVARREGLRTPTLDAQLRAHHPRVEYADASSPSAMDMREAIVILDELLPLPRQVVTDAGRFSRAVWHYLHVGRDGQFNHTTNFGSIGLGASVGLGAAIAHPEKLTVAVAGDGGMMMSLTSIQTAVLHHANMLFIVLNDSCYGAEYSKLAARGLDPEYSIMRWPEFADVARAFGAAGYVAATAAELRSAVASALSGTVPAVIDIKADADVDIRLARQPESGSSRIRPSMGGSVAGVGFEPT